MAFKAVLPTVTIFLLMVINYNCKVIKDGNTNTVQQSTLSSNEFPAFNKELIINLNGDSISGYAFIASGKEVKETVILIAGYPGNDNNFDVAQAIRRKGKNVIHFNHRGAWGSQGTYTYSNCLADIGLLIDYLSQEDISKDLRINSNGFILLGRSYGGGIALIAGSQLKEVKKIIALSSVNYGSLMNKYSNLEELSGFKKYMKKQIMINTNIDSFLQELLDKKEQFNIVNYKDLLMDKRVLIIEDSNKNEKWISELVQPEFILLESDHNFINKRLELINIIIEWMK